MAVYQYQTEKNEEIQQKGFVNILTEKIIQRGGTFTLIELVRNLQMTDFEGNKRMNIDNFISKNNLSRSPRIDSKISLYSFQKSYVSPTVSSLLNHNSKKLFSKKVSPQKSKKNLIKPTFIYFNNRNKSPKQANSNISPFQKNNNLLNH